MGEASGDSLVFALSAQLSKSCLVLRTPRLSFSADLLIVLTEAEPQQLKRECGPSYHLLFGKISVSDCLYWSKSSLAQKPLVTPPGLRPPAGVRAAGGVAGAPDSFLSRLFPNRPLAATALHISFFASDPELISFLDSQTFIVT